MLASALVVLQVFRRVIYISVVVLFSGLRKVCMFYGMLVATVAVQLRLHTRHALTELLHVACLE